jgi:NAD(P)-dependent dehydrogenase (short-subunit alcohol dehydrogenase family)
MPFYQALKNKVVLLTGDNNPDGIGVPAAQAFVRQSAYIQPEFEAHLVQVIPLRHLGLPEDIADAILSLISNKASWMMGNVLKVSSGHNLL